MLICTSNNKKGRITMTKQAIYDEVEFDGDTTQELFQQLATAYKNDNMLEVQHYSTLINEMMGYESKT